MTAATPAAKVFTAPEDRVPARTKISYGLGGCIDMWGHWLYPNLAYPVFNIFLGLSPQLVGLALMLIRIVDALSDPLFGWLSDNARTSLGRCCSSCRRVGRATSCSGGCCSRASSTSHS